MSELRVLVADDHPLFRVGLGYALGAQGFEVAAEAEDGREAVAACRRERFDVVLMDIRMPGMNGIEACREIRRMEDPPLVVMLTTFEEPGIIQAARDAGATMYLSKETSPAELARLLRAIVEEPERGWLPAVKLPELTPRERDVLALLVQGLSNKQMARELDLSPETVKDYLNGVYRKLEVRDRLAAAQRARELGLA
ncbi:MAG TPA: response regulator transcription factor [Trueperaceae bacterium]